MHRIAFKHLAEGADVGGGCTFAGLFRFGSCPGVDEESMGEALAAERESVDVPTGASVLVKSGFYEGLEVVIDRDWLVIGRGRSADLVIAEATISRAHAAIGFDADGFYLQDLGSTNGTMVNGARIERALLKSADEIQMGRLVLGVTLP